MCRKVLLLTLILITLMGCSPQLAERIARETVIIPQTVTVKETVFVPQTVVARETVCCDSHGIGEPSGLVGVLPAGGLHDRYVQALRC